MVLSKNKFIFQLNEAYEENRGYFMIYDFFPNYGKEDDYEVEYYEDEDDYNYFLDKTKSYWDCNINKYRKKYLK